MPKPMTLGSVVLIALPSNQPKGHEQEGRRPAIVVGIPPGRVRYPIVLLTPLTTQFGEWAVQNPVIYPRLNAGMGGLTQDSIVLLNQLRAIDAKRVLSYLGSLTADEYAPILRGLKQILGS